MKNFNKRAKPLLETLYLIVALAITCLVAALISLLIIKTNTSTGSSGWGTLQTCAAVNVFCICTLIFAAIEARLVAHGKRPLLFSKSAWARSSSKWQSWGLAFIWAYVLQVAAITICNFSYAMGK